MKKIIITLLMLFLTSINLSAANMDETFGCAFNLIGSPKVIGGELKFYAMVIYLRFGLDIAVDSEIKLKGDNTVSYFVEPNVGFYYYLYHHDGCSYVYTTVGLKSFDAKKREYYTLPDLYNTITVRIGYSRFFNDHVGINAEIKADTYSVCNMESVKTHRKFSDGITSSVGVIFKM